MVLPTTDAPATSPRSNDSVLVLKASRSDNGNQSSAFASSTPKLKPSKPPSLIDADDRASRGRISNNPSRPRTSSTSFRSSRLPLDRGRSLYSTRHQQQQQQQQQQRDYYSPKLDYISESEGDEPVAKKNSPSSNFNSNSKRQHKDRLASHGKGSLLSRRRSSTHDSARSSRSVHTRRRRSSASSSPSQTRLKSLTSPSLVSVLSALTTTTNSSSGSNATVTQHSYPSRDSMSEAKSQRHRSKRGEQPSQSSRRAGKPRDSEERRSMETANVFRYLESEEKAATVAGAQEQHHDVATAAEHGRAWRPADDGDDDDSSSCSEDENDGEGYDSDHSSSMTDATSVSKSSHPSPQLSLKRASLGPTSLEMRDCFQLAKLEQPSPMRAAQHPRTITAATTVDNRLVYRHPTVETVRDQTYAEHDGQQEDEEVEEEEEEEEEDDDEEYDDEDVPVLKGPYDSNSDGDTRYSNEKAPPFSKSQEEDETAKRTRRLSATAFSHIKEQSNPSFSSSYFCGGGVPPRAPSVPPRFIPTPDFTASGKTTLVGYELLASKICSSGSSRARDASTPHPQPIYRKFESINHRILLHIQDEICELEEHLRKVDESIAQLSKNYDGTHPAASRRSGAARYGAGLDFQRTDILGRLYMKMTQYSQALSQFKTITQEHASATMDEIASYRAWLKVHSVIDEAESKFLDHDDDLIRVVPTHPASVSSSSSPSSSLSSSRRSSRSSSVSSSSSPYGAGVALREADNQNSLLMRNAVLIGPASGIATYLCLQLLSGSSGTKILATLGMAVAVYFYLQYHGLNNNNNGKNNQQQQLTVCSHVAASECKAARSKRQAPPPPSSTLSS